MKLIKIIAENKNDVLMGCWLFKDFDLAKTFMKKAKAYHPSWNWFADLHDTEQTNDLGVIMLCELGEDPNKINEYK